MLRKAISSLNSLIFAKLYLQASGHSHCLGRLQVAIQVIQISHLMAALSILLDQLAGYPWPRPEHPADPYVLTVDNDIVISLYETSDERIDFYSSPGYVHDAPWLKNEKNEFSAQPWGHDARDEEVHPDIVRSIRIDPHTGLVLLIDSWPRAALDIVCFRERLAYFTELVRLWRGMVQANSDHLR